jgi:hypothetical protein
MYKSGTKPPTATEGLCYDLTFWYNVNDDVITAFRDFIVNNYIL